MATNFRDDAGIVRLDGTLYAPDATPGDVLTVQADGSLAPAAGGGGSSAVSTLLYASEPIDLAASSTAYFLFDTIYDNIYQTQEQMDLPDGIGFDPTGIGTDTLTTTEAGIWIFTLVGLSVPADATFTGDLIFGAYGVAFSRYSVAATGVRGAPTGFSETLAIPAATGFSVGISGGDAPTANPFNVGTPYLSIVRLA